MDSRRQGRIAAGFTLVVVGFFLLFLQHLRGYGESVTFGALGVAFLAGYLWRRSYGLLVPAGVLLGLAAGTAIEEALEGPTEWSLVGLGCGFFLIYGLDLAYRATNRWWPAIPGTILLLLAFPWTEALFELLLEYWPLILVLIGVILLLSALVDRPGGEPAGAGAAEPAAEGAGEEASGEEGVGDRPVQPGGPGG